MKAAVFLDRDNTIIRNDGDLGDPERVRMIQGAASAIASLKGLGYRVVVVTNQGGVARGKYGEADVEAVHQRINELVRGTTNVRIDRFYYCPYHPEGTVSKYKKEHPWRKPQPGMLLQAAKDMQLDLSRCWMIGDQPRDVEAGRAAGVRTMLLTAAAAEVPPLHEQREIEAEADPVKPDFRARNLTEAVRIIAKQRRPEISEDLRQDDESMRLPQRGDEEGSGASGGSTATQTKPRRKPQPPPDMPPEAVARRKPRPFRPLDLALIKEAEQAEAEEQEARQAAEAPAAPKALSTAAPADRATTVPDGGAPAAETETEEPALQPAAAEAPQPVRRKGRPPTPPVEATLREILAELRNQRAVGDDFSYIKMLAIVLQLIAAVCLLAAFLLGRKDLATFLPWISTAILVQLATIAMLQFAGRR